MLESIKHNKSENLQTRQEHSRSLEDKEKYKSIEYLKEVGLLIPLSSLDLYHGRATEEVNSEWKVSNKFNNADNNTGNFNINKIPTLSTDNLEIAEEFANRRSLQENKDSEIHKIISDDQDALIINGIFDVYQLPEDKRNKVYSALEKISISLTSGSPLNFKDRYELKNLKTNDLKNPEHGGIYDSEIFELSNKLGIKEELLKQIAGALNAMLMLKYDPTRTIKNFIDNKNQYSFSENKIFSINQEYIANWLRNSHIVGMKRAIWSATIDKDIQPIYMFDLEKINTEKEVNRRKENYLNKFSSIAKKLSFMSEFKEYKKSTLTSLLSENLYVKPKEIIQEAKKIEGYNDIFNADTGNREHFTLGEHTETVLRVFDENYADKLPIKLLPFMRLVILTHDLGKPEANREGNNQYEYNIKEAKNFMEKLKIDENLSKLILGIIGEGQKLTTRGFIRGDINAQKELIQYCQSLLNQYGDLGDVNKSDIIGLANMCLILQTCDNAAYTDMAITRSEKFRVNYKNSPSFNESFDLPNSINRRDIKLKKIK